VFKREKEREKERELEMIDDKTWPIDVFKDFLPFLIILKNGRGGKKSSPPPPFSSASKINFDQPPFLPRLQKSWVTPLNFSRQCSKPAQGHVEHLARLQFKFLTMPALSYRC